ncbi:FmdB family zinc ribbon protein [Staphylococcus sp. IPLA37010]|uniref:Zinc ribbon domain-containing protein n=1 Tax=Staphylococcus equorum TaxID=246432 RepID=A0AAW7AK89_9STAP|nr:FmdB family zinc ribbon protein [Staphylococcus equorum]MDK9866509.1 zinc ribbon domain-containing protein [Staphylococcus equorum]
MPNYTYVCPNCDEFTICQSMNDTHDNVSCPACAHLSKRVYTAFQTYGMDSKLKKRIEQGQKPKVVTKDKLPQKNQTTTNTARPWMAGH